MEVCLICSAGSSQLSVVTPRGLKTILECAKLRDDADVILKIKENKNFYVHKDCRKDFTNKRRIGQQSEKSKSEKCTETRSKTNAFCWKSQCFFV